ncbi:hypothetical protein J6590_046042 [Homalodisca vitripennis]|nr:hypothetical protein J6590_046042 [Homalodisca vitripennis]
MGVVVQQSVQSTASSAHTTSSTGTDRACNPVCDSLSSSRPYNNSLTASYCALDSDGHFRLLNSHRICDGLYDVLDLRPNYISYDPVTADYGEDAVTHNKLRSLNQIPIKPRRKSGSRIESYGTVPQRTGERNLFRRGTPGLSVFRPRLLSDKPLSSNLSGNKLMKDKGEEFLNGVKGGGEVTMKVAEREAEKLTLHLGNFLACQSKGKLVWDEEFWKTHKASASEHGTPFDRGSGRMIHNPIGDSLIASYWSKLIGSPINFQWETDLSSYMCDNSYVFVGEGLNFAAELRGLTDICGFFVTPNNRQFQSAIVFIRYPFGNVESF